MTTCPLTICSNIPFIEAVAACALSQPGFILINHKVPTESSDSPLIIDVVAGWGTQWIKVTARQTPSYKEEQLSNTLRRYLQAARLHPAQYRIPQVALWTRHTLPESIRLQVTALPVTILPSASLSPLCISRMRDMTHYPWSSVINLDTTALVALCSEMSHLSTEQLEALSPVKVLELDRQVQVAIQYPDILLELRRILLGYYHCEQSKQQQQQQPHNSYTRDNSFKVVVAKPVWDKFCEIASLLAGPTEQQRVDKIKRNLPQWLMCPNVNSTVLPILPCSSQLHIVDIAMVKSADTEASVCSDQSAKPIPQSQRILNLSCRLTPLQRAVFGLGDALGATTITANERAVRRIEESLGSGSNTLGVWLHTPRSFCETRL
ncbi:hypothetical protein BDF22DRAFT_227005 [Syncephalis plumigaleata]|nr:hypothetical protein BDF22DRAFT_227005 [Syncephalis plumigaleata]